MATEAEIRVVARDEASRALAAIRKELDGVGKSAQTSGGHTDNFASKVGAMATGFVAAQAGMMGVQKVLGFYGDSIKAASDLGESMNAVNKIFGTSSQKILDWGEDSANSFGLSQRAFNQLATPLGAMLKNAGEPIDAVADKTINLTERAADMASVFNTDVDQALGAITAALRGERDPIEKFGVSINEAAVKAKALSMGLLPVTQDTAELKDAQLDLAEAQEKLNKLQAQGVEVLYPTQKQLLAVEQAQAKYNDAVKKSGPGSLEARTALDALNTARENAKVKTQGSTASALELERAQLAVEQAENKVAEAAAGSTGEIDAAAKMQATYALIMEQTATSAGDFAQTSDQLANKTRIQKAEMEELQAEMGQKLLPVQLKITEAKMAMVRVLVNDVIPTLEELYRKHWPAISAVINDVVAFIKAHWPEISAVMGFVFDFVKTQIEGFIQRIQGIIAVVDGVIKMVSALWHGDWSAAWDAFKQIANGALDIVEGTIKATFGNLPGIALSAVGDLGKTLWASGKKLIQGFVDGIESAFGSVKDKLGELTGKLTDWKGPPDRDRRLLNPIGQLLMKGLSEGIEKGGQSYVATALQKITAMIQKTMSVTIQNPGSVAGKYYGTTPPPGWTGYPQPHYEAGPAGTRPGYGPMFVESSAWNPSRARSYASGTSYVPSTGLAYLHKGEAVIPAGQNSGRILNINVYVGGSIRSDKELVKLIADEINGGGFRGFIGRPA